FGIGHDLVERLSGRLLQQLLGTLADLVVVPAVQVNGRYQVVFACPTGDVDNHAVRLRGGGNCGPPVQQIAQFANHGSEHPTRHLDVEPTAFGGPGNDDSPQARIVIPLAQQTA